MLMVLKCGEGKYNQNIMQTYACAVICFQIKASVAETKRITCENAFIFQLSVKPKTAQTSIILLLLNMIARSSEIMAAACRFTAAASAANVHGSLRGAG